MTTLRPAVPADAPAIAHVHGTSWRETYTRLMPEEFLERMTDGAMRERRTANWTWDAVDPAQVVLVTERGGKVVAFASGGPARDHPSVDAELFTLYALKEVQGQGIGRALLSAVAVELHERGHRTLALWALDVNPTRGWYVRQGGREAGEKTEPLPGGGELREVRLVWDDLTRLQQTHERPGTPGDERGGIPADGGEEPVQARVCGRLRLPAARPGRGQ